MLLFEDDAEFAIDFVDYSSSGSTLLFLSPYQQLKWLNNQNIPIQVLKFHGDYYCIEYHKKEVACNGLLFNNIYENPYFPIGQSTFDEIKELLQRMEREMANHPEDPFADSVLRSYLQLILAISSKEKSKTLPQMLPGESFPDPISRFQSLLDQHFITERSVSFYADVFALSTNAFSKKVKHRFGKAPSQLIKERVILEAKKMLHLSYLSIKEIADQLTFEDEFYFSRYFKKEVGVSPSHYRRKVGISIVAEKSID
ncbi:MULTISPECIES: helix-turn-helix domain-containing protein [Sphingobacterium]|uniref:helix-turn-helix domain-containing protein n=1 Tax=Sphingobacterium TaxID=28453 RepID=UPI002242C706|nr:MULTISPECIES: AraC family transcriptional regulator [Sphingobacterium]MCW8311137.1 AraC family transcriptional regulator [Sphingobacterium sp. InxBP1]